MLLPMFTAIQGTVFVSISDVIFDPRLIEALVNVIKILLRWVETFRNCYLTRPVTCVCSSKRDYRLPQYLGSLQPL